MAKTITDLDQYLKDFFVELKKQQQDEAVLKFRRKGEDAERLWVLYSDVQAIHNRFAKDHDLAKYDNLGNGDKAQLRLNAVNYYRYKAKLYSNPKVTIRITNGKLSVVAEKMVNDEFSLELDHAESKVKAVYEWKVVEQGSKVFDDDEDAYRYLKTMAGSQGFNDLDEFFSFSYGLVEFKYATKGHYPPEKDAKGYKPVYGPSLRKTSLKPIIRDIYK